MLCYYFLYPLDVPLSFVFDTICLPYYVFQTEKEETIEEEADEKLEKS